MGPRFSSRVASETTRLDNILFSPNKGFKGLSYIGGDISVVKNRRRKMDVEERCGGKEWRWTRGAEMDERSGGGREDWMRRGELVYPPPVTSKTAALVLLSRHWLNSASFTWTEGFIFRKFASKTRPAAQMTPSPSQSHQTRCQMWNSGPIPRNGSLLGVLRCSLWGVTLRRTGRQIKCWRSATPYYDTGVIHFRTCGRNECCGVASRQQCCAAAVGTSEGEGERDAQSSGRNAGKLNANAVSNAKRRK
ncbi:hypothetical protein BCR34DRAFT_568376 [Clohesyomyces aquaticus]|uniref:Uncharacterized protein n=1 Tax=Clohesyomyces aquaticus TaxID=1231657 RepID=A0A1Y1ZGP0_9PLEO|nr:hypothetical protein BCR34DRAFT_568376 [Clohesyomyces aquaticus]